MNKERTLEILRALADGIDPFKKIPVADDNVLQNPEVIRALHSAIFTIVGIAHEREIETQNTENQGKSHLETSAYGHQQPEVNYRGDRNNFLETDSEPSDLLLEDNTKSESYCLDNLEDEDEDEDEDAIVAIIENAALDWDDQQTRELLLSELFDDRENFARSEEDGWYYPDTEGSWEDNLWFEADF